MAIASAALLGALNETAGLRFDTSAFENDAVVQRSRLDQLVASNEEHVSMVQQLERAYDAMEDQVFDETDERAFDPLNLPSGDELAAELERFLRDQGG